MAINDDTKIGKNNSHIFPKNDAQKCTVGNGAVGDSDYITVEEYGNGVIHKTVLTCTALPISVADEAGQGQYGGVKVYDMPEGLILTLGAVIDGSITMPAPIIDAWDGDIGLGTAAPTDHQTGLGNGILQTTATTQAVSKVAVVDAISAAAALTESAGRCLDGTSTPIDVFLNLLIDDNAAHTAATGSFTGTITLTWVNLGDK